MSTSIHFRNTWRIRTHEIPSLRKAFLSHQKKPQRFFLLNWWMSVVFPLHLGNYVVFTVCLISRGFKEAFLWIFLPQQNIKASLEQKHVIFLSRKTKVWVSALQLTSCKSRQIILTAFYLVSWLWFLISKTRQIILSVQPRTQDYYVWQAKLFHWKCFVNGDNYTHLKYLSFYVFVLTKVLAQWQPLSEADYKQKIGLS